MGHSIEQVDPRGASEEFLTELWEYYKTVYEEEIPGDPVRPLARQVAEWQNLPDDHLVDRWIMRDDADSTIIAVGVSFRDKTQNIDNGFVRVYVREDRRLQGLAKTLAAPILDLLAADSRTRVATNVTRDAEAGEAFAAQLGLRKVYSETQSRLTVSEIDPSLIQSWIERAGERAGDYELVFAQSPMPDEMVEKYCELQFQMNTAPLDDFEQDDEVVTPELWRDLEANQIAAQKNLSTYVAVHKPTDDYVGSTTIETDVLWPEQAWQWETVVHPDHRNLGLGRWLKAAMIEEVTSTTIPVQRIDTENAGSNEPMLNINIAMGFKPIRVGDVWQGDLAKAREILSS